MTRRQSLTLTLLAAVAVIALVVSAISIPRFGALRCQATPIGADWDHTFGGLGIDEALCAQQTADGGFVLVGNTYSSEPGGAWLVKTDASGVKEWDQIYSGVASWGQQTADGGYIIAGAIQSDDPAGGKDGWLLKADASGEVEWSHKFTAPVFDLPPQMSPYKGDDEFRHVQQTSDGGYVAVGHAVVTPGDYSTVAAWILKADSSGTLQWQCTFFHYGYDDQETYWVQETTDGGFVLAGVTVYEIIAREDAWLLKTDSSGNEVWTRTLDYDFSDVGYSVQQTSEGGYIVAGTRRCESAECPAGVETVLVKTDSSGVPQWDRTFGGPEDDYGYAVEETSDGGYIIGGTTSSYGAGGSDVWLLKTDSSGNKQWDKTFGGSADDSGYSVQQTSDGGFVVAGVTSSYGSGDRDAWLIKVHDPPSVPNQPGNILPVNATTGVSLTPTLQSSAFSDPDPGDTHAASQWQITTTAGHYSSSVFDSGADSSNLTQISLPSGALNSNTQYYWHVRHLDSHQDWSEWSAETSFTTLNRPPNQPGNVSPPNGATEVSLTPTLQSSTFSDLDAGDPHAATQWQITSVAGDYSSPVFDSGAAEPNTAIHVTSGVLDYSNIYCWHVRYQDSHGAWSDWSAETSFATVNRQPDQPLNSSPVNGSAGISVATKLESSAFSDPDAGDTHAASQWQVTAIPGNYFDPIFDSGTDAANLMELDISPGILDGNATYYWHVRYQDNHGGWSDWSAETSFSTVNRPPTRPQTFAPADGATGVSLTPTLESSAFADPDSGDIHAASQWQITTTAGDYSDPVFDSGVGIQITLSLGILDPNTTYYWHIRHQDNHGAWSDWSDEAHFTTLAQDGEVGGCCSSSNVDASPGDIAIAWGTLGLCSATGLLFARRLRRRTGK